MRIHRPAPAPSAAASSRRAHRALRASAPAALVAAVVLTVSACTSQAPADGSATSVAPSSPAPSDEAPAGVTQTALSAPLDHVHGLLVSGDGTLLAGTHTGVVAVTTGGDVSRVGSSRDDLMGMTGIPGSDRLASSGHPGAGSAFPNPVGLIVSDDGGLTWSAVSLTGRVDFHTLATDGTLVVGYGGGSRVLVSTDGGATFTSGGAVAPAALAITPGSVWATTADGLQRSTDDGDTFTVVDGAPVLVLVAVGPDASLWGVDTQGVAWRSADGTTWERRATVGPVEALAVAEHATAYALTATTLYELT